MAKTVTFRFHKGKEAIREELERIARDRGIAIGALIVEAIEEKLGSEFVSFDLSIPRTIFKEYEAERSSESEDKSGLDAIREDLAKILKIAPEVITLLRK